MTCHHYHTGVLITTSPSVYLNLSSCIITINLIQSAPLMGNPFLHSSSCKNLDINFSDNLTWRLHYQNITFKAYKSFGLLRCIFKDNYCPEARKNLYISIIRSTLLYCSCLWKPYQLCDIKLIERVQKRATKYILCDYNNDYKLRLMRLKLLPLM